MDKSLNEIRNYINKQSNCTTNMAQNTYQINKRPLSLTKALSQNEQSNHESLTHIQ